MLGGKEQTTNDLEMFDVIVSAKNEWHFFCKKIEKNKYAKRKYKSSNGEYLPNH